MTKEVLSLKKIIIFILIFCFVLTSTGLAIDSELNCDCQEYRKLSLQEPRLKGNDVLELQKELKDLGFYKDELTSIYDRNTYLAVKEFQKERGLSVTGKAEKHLWLELAKALGKKPTTIQVDKKSPPEGEVLIVVDGYARQLIVYVDGEKYQTFPVAIGKPSTKSPVGEWTVISKNVRRGGALGVRWIRLNVPWGNYGIHGTNQPGSIGRAASKGCIRMFNRDVKVLYPWVEVGTKVKIIGRRDPIEITHNLRPHQAGKDVLLLQEKLREYGFNAGRTDGRFGEQTIEAIKEFKYIYGLQDDLIGDKNTLYILGIE